MIEVSRRFVEVDGRRVHYRTAGSGPPLVLMHGSPGDSTVVEHEMAAAAAHFTCFAIDTPGFGCSDPLPSEGLTVAGLARAMAATIAALGIAPCTVYGTHTGALIATELAAGWPETVTGLVAEGLPIFTDAEITELFESHGDYFATMVPDPLAGHLVTTWMRFRDQFTWFPWASRNVARLNPVDRPTAEEIHLWVMMFYRSCRTYGAAYRAVCYHGHRACLAAGRVTAPAVFMASAEDMLFGHLDRLPPLRPGQRIERVAHDPPAKYRAIVDFARGLPMGAPVSGPAPAGFAGADPAVRFVDRTFVRSYGKRAAPALMLLHDMPGSGLALHDLALDLAREWHVIVPDLPGCGESGLRDGPPVDVAADALTAIAQALDLTGFAVAAWGCASAVATALAARVGAGVTRLLLERAIPADPALAADIAPDLPLQAEGSHWLTAWLMVRDNQIYDPWFAGTVAAQRRNQGNFGAQWLHDQTFEIMKARTTYTALPRAAWQAGCAPTPAGIPVHIGDPVALIRSHPIPVKDPL
jgi:pimeloyl-ACP methyl ester carboxylesterase